MPSRRAVLAILTAAFAGCTTSTNTNRTTAPPTAPTTRRPGAREEIETARARLRAALDIYVTDAGPDATLRDVTAASPEPFPWRGVVGECRAADDTIRAGREVALDDQQQTLDELAAASRFLQASARLQRDLIRAEGALREVRDAVYGDSPSRADDRRATVERTLEASTPQMEAVAARDPAAVAGALDALDADLVRAKRAQFRREDRQMWDLSSALASVMSGLSAITAGWSAWTDGGYERADYEFGTAVEDLAAARSHLDEEWTTGLRGFGTGVTGAVDALHTGGTHLQRAAAEMLDENANTANRHVTQARTAFRERDVVATEVRAVQPILGG